MCVSTSSKFFVILIHSLLNIPMLKIYENINHPVLPDFVTVLDDIAGLTRNNNFAYEWLEAIRTTTKIP